MYVDKWKSKEDMHPLYEFQYSDKMDLKYKIYTCIRKSICYIFSFVHMSLVLSPLIVASRGPNAVVIFLCVNAKYSQKRHCWFIGTIASVTQLRMYSFNKHRKTWWLLRTIALCMKDKTVKTYKNLTRFLHYVLVSRIGNHFVEFSFLNRPFLFLFNHICHTWWLVLFVRIDFFWSSEYTQCYLI